jgi:tRNA A-37 threonylcarbamoyl transferase component Bud32
MINIFNKLLIVFIFLCTPYMAAINNDDQHSIDNLIRSIVVQQRLQYIPLRGGSDAQISRVVIEPSSYVLRRMSDKVSLEKCICECVIASICSEQGIGPRIYVADPLHKIIVSDYVQDQGVPRKQFGTQKFLCHLGSLIQKLHTLNVQDIESAGSIMFNGPLQIADCNLFAINKIGGKIEHAYNQLLAVGIPPEKLKNLTEKLMQKLSEAYTTNMVFSHGDLHWGNCLYSHDRIWLIDYETNGLAPWWYDLGVVGAHFSFSQESDDYLLEGYFGNSRNQCTAEEKEHYLCMKQIAMLFYGLHRLAECSLDTLQHAYAAHINLAAVQEAYRNGTLSLESEYVQAIIALAMIHSVLDAYPKLVNAVVVQI